MQLPPRKPSIQKQPSKDDVPVKKWRDPLHERVKENIDKTLANEVPKGHTLTKNESLRSKYGYFLVLHSTTTITTSIYCCPQRNEGILRYRLVFNVFKVF